MVHTSFNAALFSCEIIATLFDARINGGCGNMTTFIKNWRKMRVLTSFQLVKGNFQKITDKEIVSSYGKDSMSKR